MISIVSEGVVLEFACTLIGKPLEVGSDLSDWDDFPNTFWKPDAPFRSNKAFLDVWICVCDNSCENLAAETQVVRTKSETTEGAILEKAVDFQSIVLGIQKEPKREILKKGIKDTLHLDIWDCCLDEVGLLDLELRHRTGLLN